MDGVKQQAAEEETRLPAAGVACDDLVEDAMAAEKTSWREDGSNSDDVDDDLASATADPILLGLRRQFTNTVTFNCAARRSPPSAYMQCHRQGPEMIYYGFERHRSGSRALVMLSNHHRAAVRNAAPRSRRRVVTLPCPSLMWRFPRSDVQTQQP